MHVATRSWLEVAGVLFYALHRVHIPTEVRDELLQRLAALTCAIVRITAWLIVTCLPANMTDMTT